ncbi:TIM barrel protein [Nocardiopsis mangrovi]|uniref:TIM barrel protein n=1 Tax=Nocardiopsis mangrovi TaxID=1179818 RepID=A0ABV9DXI5_9ACTN
MCYGYDGHAALARSRAGNGGDRRSFLRGSAAVLAATGLAATGLGGAAPAVADSGHGRGWGRRVPADKISIQLYTMRDSLGGEPGFDQTLAHIADIGYPRVEVAGYYGRTAAELRTFFDGLGIEPGSSHEGISDSEEALETKLDNALTLGQWSMVVPYLVSAEEDDWKRWAEQMNVEAAAARSVGLRYGYHNHAHEFTTDLGNGRTPWDVLTEELDPRLVHFEIDIYWAVTGGIESGDGADDPERFTLDVIRAARQKTLQFHVKDRAEADGDTADLGTGIIDFARIFRAHKVREYIVENDTPDDTPENTAEVGYRYLRELCY